MFNQPSAALSSNCSMSSEHSNNELLLDTKDMISEGSRRKHTETYHLGIDGRLQQWSEGVTQMPCAGDSAKDPVSPFDISKLMEDRSDSTKPGTLPSVFASPIEETKSEARTKPRLAQD